jgi:hypothetical protein
MKNQRLFVRLVIPILLGISFTLGAVVSITVAQENSQQDNSEATLPPEETGESSELLPVEPLFVPSRAVSESITNVPYARVITDDAPVYQLAFDEANTITYTRKLTKGFYYVSLENTEPITYDNQAWYQINPDEYVKAEHLRRVTATQFAGVHVTRQPEHSFGWVIRKTPVVSSPGQSATDSTVYLPRYTLVTIYETYYGGEWGWHRIGEDEWIQLYDVGKVDPMSRPNKIPAGDRWVAVDLFEQTFAAYNENDQMVYATLIASGLPADGWRTPAGLFHIKSARITGKMAGGGMNDYYYLEDVRATMFFTESYAFHAAYWHDDFGRFKSHGCVNMTPIDANWMFMWATPTITSVEERVKIPDDAPQTWVWIHNGLLNEIEANNTE